MNVLAVACAMSTPGFAMRAGPLEKICATAFVFAVSVRFRLEAPIAIKIAKVGFVRIV